MRQVFVLFIIIACISLASAEGIFNSSISVGAVKKGSLKTLTFNTVALPATTFQLNAVQIFLINETSHTQFAHDQIVIASVDFTSGGKKLVGFTASTVANPLIFPSPYALGITGAIDISVSLFTTNMEPVNVTLEYYLKWSTDANYTPLTRTATSCVANYSSFIVPGTGGQYTVQNTIAWQQNINAMSFEASGSQGILTLTLQDSTGTVVCKSSGVYKNNVLISMTPCTDIVALVKGTSYTTIAVYDNTIQRKGVFGNFALYVGFTPKPTTTTTGGSSSGHTTTATTNTASTTGGSSSGPHSTTTTGGSSSGKTSGGSSSGKSSGGSAGGSSGKSSAGGSAGGSSGKSSSSGSQTSGSHDGSSSQNTGSQNTGSQNTGSQNTGGFTTTSATSSAPTGGTSSQTSASPTVSPTGYSVSSGEMNVWDKSGGRGKSVKFY